MKNKNIVYLLALCFVLLMGGAGLLYRQLGQTVPTDQLAQQTQQSSQPAQPQQEEPDDTDNARPRIKAPDFVVYDAQGGEVRLSQYIGTPIVLNFWASWCDPCQGEMPDFHEKYLDQGQDVHFLMINMTDGFRETPDTAAAFLEENGYTFPLLYDLRADAAYAYGAFSMPITFFIDADGYVLAHVSGPISGELLQQGIDLIRGEAELSL